ncbi:hypothetical protein Thena_1473 [Thermodesulfobium narugense DSM 14796]|uniref:Uncharacterized protein n=1 Tax=Thermodesulfobium narugense DSM 14796 TaxID=747365 RepID=M1E8P9_9BACT|nr:hypothetical protein [Thermodesulfobium narugense]AEE15085.1 hypothetical protein Thena_1473 [Thermodesulfobium narugense DSM 14796]
MWCSGPGFYGHGFYGMPFFGMLFPIFFLAVLVFALFYFFRPTMSRCSVLSSSTSNEELIKEINSLKEEIKRLKEEK